MIRKKDLNDIAELKGLSLVNAEKDYLLEILLFLLSEKSRFLVFKGGTALYKFHGLNRFSEDLDMDLLKKRIKPDREVDRIRKNLELLSMKGTIGEFEEHGNETNLRFSIRGPLYDGRKESMARITINLSSRERPLYFTRKHMETVYNDIPSFEMQVLEPVEICAEKIRCVVERDKPRDIYDLYFLFNRGILPDANLVNRKLTPGGSSFDKDLVIDRIGRMKGIWRKDLEGLVMGPLPSFTRVKGELEDYLDRIN